LLNALSYRGVLARGFALVRDEAGHPLHAAADVASGARMSLEFADGRIGVTADGSEATATPVSAKPATREAKPATLKRAAKPVDQGSLF
jgi:exodeoxyribonuclease VII large subunit